MITYIKTIEDSVSLYKHGQLIAPHRSQTSHLLHGRLKLTA